ncbi:MAG TPA: heavy metal-binding domain-containing protein [Actinomycetota bacterium]|nr:heavy metal-binding domain-containing protein [Actinomycetota bacterium]
MSFFHRRGSSGADDGPNAADSRPAPPSLPPVDPAVAAAEVQAAIAALEQGGIPPKAQARLAELRQGNQTLFTSDLSVAEFALLARVGLRPVSQVMGSSVYHVGWQGMPGSYFGVGRGAYELTMLSDAWNQARGLALSRLQQEALHAGADAVVGVRITWGAHDFAPNSVEMVAVGTAVRTGSAEPSPSPVLTDLSGQEVYNLLSAGFRPVGVVGATTVFYVVPQWATQNLTSGWGSWSANAELPDFTQALYTAREVAFGHLGEQARRLGAHGVVGVSIRQDVHTREIDQNGSKRIDLIVQLHVLGTAIIETSGAAGALPVKTNLDLSV